MKRKTKLFLNNIATYLMVILVFAVVTLLQAQGKLSYSIRQQLVPICVYIVMAISLNLVVGVSGDLSLGHAGFMSVGAFSGGIACQALATAIPDPTLRLIAGMLVGGVFAAIAGVLVGVPVLRLRGDYLAIVTLAFGEIIRNVLNILKVSVDEAGLHFAFGPDASLPGTMIVNGAMGLQKMTKISTFTMGFVLILFSLVVVLNLMNSRSGRAMMAIRDNRIAAESVGISVTKYKLMAFVISAALAGMAGTLYCMNFSTITAAKFKFDTSILILVFVVLGGIGNIRGSIIAAALLTALPEMLRSFKAFSDYRMLIYAIILIAIMLISNGKVWSAVIAVLLLAATAHLLAGFQWGLLILYAAVIAVVIFASRSQWVAKQFDMIKQKFVRNKEEGAANE